MGQHGSKKSVNHPSATGANCRFLSDVTAKVNRRGFHPFIASLICAGGTCTACGRPLTLPMLMLRAAALRQLLLTFSVPSSLFTSLLLVIMVSLQMPPHFNTTLQ